MEPSEYLTDDLIQYGNNERININKETIRNNNQPYAFLDGGNFGEQIVLLLFPNSIGGASKGGIAYDNKTLNENKEIVSAREVKFVSRIGTKICKKCEQKCPQFQKECIYCNSEDFKPKNDSRACISSDAHIKYKHVITEYIIFVQDYNYDTKIISLKAFKFLSKNESFDKYIQNQYDRGKKKGGSCNFIPYSYDWWLSGPILIMDVSIDISQQITLLKYHCVVKVTFL